MSDHREALLELMRSQAGDPEVRPMTEVLGGVVRDTESGAPPARMLQPLFEEVAGRLATRPDLLKEPGALGSGADSHARWMRPAARRSPRGLLFDALLSELLDRHPSKDLVQVLAEGPPDQDRLSGFDVLATVSGIAAPRIAAMERHPVLLRVLEDYEKSFRIWLARLLHAAGIHENVPAGSPTLGHRCIGKDLRDALERVDPGFVALVPRWQVLLRNALAHGAPDWNRDRQALRVALRWTKTRHQTLWLTVEDLDHTIRLLLDELHPGTGHFAMSRLSRMSTEPSRRLAMGLERAAAEDPEQFIALLFRLASAAGGDPSALGALVEREG